MASRLLFLVATFGLFATAASFYDEDLELYLDDNYDVVLQAVVKMLWKSFETDIRKKSNVLLFGIPTARDISFINEVMDEEMKERIKKSLPLYDNFDDDIEKVEERLTGSEMRFMTIFHGELEDMNKRLLVGNAYTRLSESNNRFKLIIHNKDDIMKKQNKLYPAIRDSGLGVNCGVGYCSWHKILHYNDVDPFSIFTLASWKITSIERFSFRTKSEFVLSGTSSTKVDTVQSSGNFDYAEFKYPKIKGCIGRVLRLPYKFNLNLTFVIPSNERRCGSPEDLWKNVQNINLNALRYKNRKMFVSIPLFNVAANIDLRMKLKGTVLAQAFDQPSSRLYNTQAFQAAEVTFNPQVQKNMPAPIIPEDEASTFKVDRPFYFSLFHRISPIPIIAGLVNNPGCIRNCLPALVVE